MCKGTWLKEAVLTTMGTASFLVNFPLYLHFSIPAFFTSRLWANVRYVPEAEVNLWILNGS